tara:strand:- start:3271 stop:3579 length:309 start_codon:yes stop_codon:yes gene_type:complete
MAFKINRPYPNYSTAIHEVALEEGVLGKADRNGNILINKDITDPKQRKDVIKHEEVHIKQMKDGILDYDDKYVYYRGKRYARSKMKEGSPALQWEKDANKKQ